MLSPIDLNFEVALLVEYTKRYTAAFLNVLLTPSSAKMVYQDGNSFTVNSKSSTYILQSPFSHGQLPRQEKGNSL